jgi:hypothetical protein
VLKALATASGLVDNLSFIFTVVILLIVFLLLVIVLTIFQVVLGLLLDLNRSLL